MKKTPSTSSCKCPNDAAQFKHVQFAMQGGYGVGGVSQTPGGGLGFGSQTPGGPGMSTPMGGMTPGGGMGDLGCG